MREVVKHSAELAQVIVGAGGVALMIENIHVRLRSTCSVTSYVGNSKDSGELGGRVTCCVVVAHVSNVSCSIVMNVKDRQAWHLSTTDLDCFLPELSSSPAIFTAEIKVKGNTPEITIEYETRHNHAHLNGTTEPSRTSLPAL